jgi:hypothetical protein
MKHAFGTPIAEYLPALGFLLFTVVYLALAYTYNADARTFPAGVAWVMLVLTLLDLASLTKTNIGLALTKLLNPSSESARTKGDAEIPIGKLAAAVAWIFGFAALMLVIGIPFGVMVFVFSYIRFKGGRSYLTSTAIGAAVALAIWLLFSFVLRIELYPGVLFSDA